MYPPVYSEDPEEGVFHLTGDWEEGAGGSDHPMALQHLSSTVRSSTNDAGWALIAVTLAFCILLAVVGGVIFLSLPRVP